MTRQQKRTIEREFYRYKENKAMGGEFIKDYAYSRIAVNYESDRVCGSGINTTEKSVVDAISKDVAKNARAFKWTLVFERTMDRVRFTQKDKLMRLKYIERRNVLSICEELHISRATYFYWKDEVLLHAFQWVCALNMSI